MAMAFISAKRSIAEARPAAEPDLAARSKALPALATKAAASQVAASAGGAARRSASVNSQQRRNILIIGASVSLRIWVSHP